MKVIDADAHVIESESTWDSMLESERQFRPRIIRSDADPTIEYWHIDGRLMPRSNVEKKLPEAARDMSDVSLRIKHMDALRIDVQVIYPTIFIFPTARRPEADLAICRSYNRWMAEVVARRGGLAVLPQDIPIDVIESVVDWVKSRHPLYETAITLAPTNTVGDALSLIHKRAHGAVIVVEEDRPVGVFTEHDAIGFDRFTQLHAVMSRELVTVPDVP